VRFIPLLVFGQIALLAVAVADATTGSGRTLAIVIALGSGAIAARSARAIPGARAAIAIGAVTAVLGLLTFLDAGLLPTIRLRL
jgi:hypothetical protein